VQGRVRTGSYDDNGTTRYFTTITADRVNLLGSKKNAENEPKQPNTAEYDEDNLPW
jgi:single-stranded DNA-binding protein